MTVYFNRKPKGVPDFEALQFTGNNAGEISAFYLSKGMQPKHIEYYWTGDQGVELRMGRHRLTVGDWLMWSTQDTGFTTSSSSYIQYNLVEVAAVEDPK